MNGPVDPLAPNARGLTDEEYLSVQVARGDFAQSEVDLVLAEEAVKAEGVAGEARLVIEERPDPLDIGFAPAVDPASLTRHPMLPMSQELPSI